MGILLYTYMHIDLYTYLQDADHESSQGPKTKPASLGHPPPAPYIPIRPYAQLMAGYMALHKYKATFPSPTRGRPLFPRTGHVVGPKSCCHK